MFDSGNKTDRGDIVTDPFLWGMPPDDFMVVFDDGGLRRWNWNPLAVLNFVCEIN